MDINGLIRILDETTILLRKGEVLTGSPHLVEAVKQGRDLGKERGGVLIIEAMPHENEGLPPFTVKVDLALVTVGVLPEAVKRRDDLIRILDDYPDPDRLAGGPSYIEVGGVIGNQGYAFRLFALGHVLKLWNVVTPATLGVTGQSVMALAGMGYVMITGYKVKEKSNG